MASFSSKDIEESIEKSDDIFGKRIADATTNVIDLASHYQFSPERLRLFTNGSRQFVQYGETSGFTDAADVWQLSPAAGDTMHIESAESGTYTVNYTIQHSQAFGLNQELQDGDRLRCGPYNGTDGWYIEQRGADHAADQVDLIQERGGTQTTLAADVTLPKPLTEFNRHEIEYAWYNVSGQVWTVSHTIVGDDSAATTQANDEYASTAMDSGRGPETGNLNIWFEVTASATTTDLTLDVGSSSIIVLGDARTLQRDKPQRVQVTLPSTNDTWLPVYAVRIAPDNANVNCNLTILDIMNYGNNADLDLLAVSVDASNTDASGWDTPEFHHAQNSALQSTTNISEVPNTSGTQTTLGSSEFVGGYTLASAAIAATGNTRETSGTRSGAVLEKKSILNSDHLVFLARTGNAGATLDFIWDADQNW